MDIKQVDTSQALARFLNERQNHVAIIEITSLVNGKALSSFVTYQVINKALYTHFEGEYDTKEGFSGVSIIDDIDNRGTILNVGEESQLFIHKDAKINITNPHGVDIVEIKDKRSSMNIRISLSNEKIKEQ
ncbi:MAG TPA: hypothetical protein VK085_07565 [Pseudogracilibacillus sp.]|nr:hypothetical protein [Pseudogracilibacillus sp.]